MIQCQKCGCVEQIGCANEECPKHYVWLDRIAEAEMNVKVEPETIIEAIEPETIIELDALALLSAVPEVEKTVNETQLYSV